MVLNLLPEKIYGVDVDDWLAYTTPKAALIRDRYVGAAYYFLIALAMCWVLIGQVLWRNEHFLLKDVKGVSRMWLSHPTRNQCDANEPSCASDFKSMTDLDYCTEYDGSSDVPHPAACLYADKHSMFTDGTLGSQVFIPTAVVVLEESKHCHPSDRNGYSCENEYMKERDGESWYFNETRMQYYADVEDYIIQFTSTYHRESISGTSLDHPGFYDECFDKDETTGKTLSWEERSDSRRDQCKDERRMAVHCMHGVACEKGGLKTLKDLGKIKADGLDLDNEEAAEDSLVQVAGVSTSRRALRSKTTQHQFMLRTRKGGPGTFNMGDDETKRPTPDVYASTWGDTFKLGKLLQLAKVDLDKHFNMDDLSARMAGTIIEVEATYTNLRRFLSSFGLSQVQYTFRVKERKLPYVSKEWLHPEQPEDFPLRRKYIVQHGILLDFKVGGEFGFFSIVYLLIMLTTSMALLATAHKITDLSALYLHPRRKNYFHLKYDVSADFSDMWHCKECGYYNHPNDKFCKGLDKWESAYDTPLCGCPRPLESTKSTAPLSG